MFSNYIYDKDLVLRVCKNSQNSTHTHTKKKTMKTKITDPIKKWAKANVHRYFTDIEEDNKVK